LLGSVAESVVRSAGKPVLITPENFIKAEVIGFDDFVTVGGWKEARGKGKVRSEGRDYLVQDGDIIEFKIGN